jgi:hypothetical protein
MSASGWRFLSLPLVVVAFLLAGAPEFPALGRAVAKAFATVAGTSVPDLGNAGTSVPDLGSAGTSVPAAQQVRVQRDDPSHRGALVPLYLSYAALQALDLHSTVRALDAGGIEMNPVMRGASGNPAALVAVKAGLAASTIYFVEKMRAKHRRAAILLMTALNSAYAAIVIHNYRAVTP